MTRAAAARNQRGIIPGPTEINSSLHPQPAKISASQASSDAMEFCASKIVSNPSRKIARSGESCVRYPG
jgi:hypothetical protein